MTYINPNGLSYINKRPINVKKVENNDKVAWRQNKIQLIVLLLYTNALLCMWHYNSSTPFDSSGSSATNPAAIWCYLRYINVIRASIITASRICLTLYPSGKIPLLMHVYAISTMRRHLGKTATSFNCVCSSSSIS